MGFLWHQFLVSRRQECITIGHELAQTFLVKASMAQQSKPKARSAAYKRSVRNFVAGTSDSQIILDLTFWHLHTCEAFHSVIVRADAMVEHLVMQPIQFQR